MELPLAGWAVGGGLAMIAVAGILLLVVGRNAPSKSVSESSSKAGGSKKKKKSKAGNAEGGSVASTSTVSRSADAVPAAKAAPVEQPTRHQQLERQQEQEHQHQHQHQEQQQQQQHAEQPQQQSQPVAKKPKEKETPAQKAARAEKEKAKKELKRQQEEQDARLASALVASQLEEEGQAAGGGQSSQADGWAVVDGKANKKAIHDTEAAAATAAAAAAAVAATPAPAHITAPAPTPAAAPASAPAPAPAAAHAAPAAAAATEPSGPAPVTSTIEVDAKKIGILIGPKGVTKMAIQEKTGVEITLPQKDPTKEVTGPVDVTITGPSEGVFYASRAIRDLASKGYCALLGGEGFSEGHILVHPMYLPDIIGAKGVSIRAIQESTGVHLRVPSGVTRGDAQPVKIDVAGQREKVVAAKALIKELCKFRHHPVTHPGSMHIEMEVPAQYHSYIIGAKGSEIRHIQANFKVAVHIPNEHTHCKGVLIVGERAGCEAAERYIKKIVDQAIQRQKDRDKEFSDDVEEEEEEEPSAEDEWSGQYDASKRSGPTIASVFTATQKGRQGKPWGAPAPAVAVEAAEE